jgi:Bacterial nucleoid DNA-binding protein
MQTINFHLAYLLISYECVIIPGFGAFVTFSASAKKEERSEMWHAPKQWIGFNETIRHNDGLLANSIAKEKNVSYKEATILINQYVDQLEEALSSGEFVAIPFVGSFSLHPNRSIEFKPAVQPSCSLRNTGFSNFYFPSLSEIEKERKQDKPETVIPKVRTYAYIKRACITAAAVVALFAVTIPTNDYLSNNGVQNAGMVSLPAVNMEPAAPEEGVSNAIILPVQKEEPKTAINPANIRYYYIIVSSLPNRPLAKQRALEIKEQMLFQAGVVSSDEKHRVYVNRFEDKEEAEAFLQIFRQAYPKHQNAWLLSQKG